LNSWHLNPDLEYELVIYLAPCLIGNAAQDMLKLPELLNLEDKRALKIHDVRAVGQDIRIIARFADRMAP
jgi:diaminohydroxyphosphoribosylaminopyrimidine deaminase/5-amino-6-(5-phosphoribosylamino)uracil reductase